MTQKNTEKKSRLGYLDVLRALAMLPVVAAHYIDALGSVGVTCPFNILPIKPFGVYLGNVGVSVFFIVSGASLMCVYGGRKLQTGQYFKKRFLGILPMFWIAYIVAFVFFRAWNNFPGTEPWKAIFTLLGVDGYVMWITPTFYLLGEWFLGCIILLYLLFPLLKAGLEKKPYLTWGVVLLLWIVGPFVYEWKIPDEIFFLFRIPEFFFGMWFVSSGKKVTLPAFITGAAGLILLSVLNLDFIPTVYRNPFVGICLFLVIVWLCQNIKSSLFYKIFEVAGKHGYAVLLTHHLLVIYLVGRFAGQTFSAGKNFLVFGVYLAGVIVASAVLYKVNALLLNIVAKRKGNLV